MITIHELLEDPVYKKYFLTVPKLNSPSDLPWRVAIQREAHGPWGTKDFATYPEAFKLLKKNLTRINDAAIISKAHPFEAPGKTVRVKGKYLERRGKKIPVTKRIKWVPQMPMDEIDPHHWCPYCRRPTVFKRFIIHPVLTRRKMNGMVVDPEVLRCSICGSSERIVDLRG